jgi:hypothetical protein
MAKTSGEELLSLLDYVHERLFTRLGGIGDTEYLWEPVAGCWSLRRGDDVVFRADYAHPAPEPPPFTTIAWRIWHIGDCLQSYSARFFERADAGTDTPARTRDEWPGAAADGVAAMDVEWVRFRAHAAKLDAEASARPLGPAAGPFAEDSYHSLVLHALDEVIHHGAEIGVLRDLYTHRAV